MTDAFGGKPCQRSAAARERSPQIAQLATEPVDLLLRVGQLLQGRQSDLLQLAADLGLDGLLDQLTVGRGGSNQLVRKRRHLAHRLFEAGRAEQGLCCLGRLGAGQFACAGKDLQCCTHAVERHGHSLSRPV
ncbi:hypothetical protein IEE94_14935 [Yimella sp. cx-573]|nr:hypothetical protein [Yimella sp. cx-573]